MTPLNLQRFAPPPFSETAACLAATATTADRVAATWRLSLPYARRKNSPLRMALEAHFHEVRVLFDHGATLTQLWHALAERGVAAGGQPLTRDALCMAWIRLGRVMAGESKQEMAA